MDVSVFVLVMFCTGCTNYASLIVRAILMHFTFNQRRQFSDVVFQPSEIYVKTTWQLSKTSQNRRALSVSQKWQYVVSFHALADTSPLIFCTDKSTLINNPITAVAQHVLKCLTPAVYKRNIILVLSNLVVEL